MLTARYFRTLSFPWRLVSPEGALVDSANGTLFPLPSVAALEASEKYYLTAPSGWSICPAGYAVYARVIPALYNQKLVLPGLKVNGVSRVFGKAEGLAIRTEKEIVERYVQDTLVAFSGIEEYLKSILNRSVHEVRGLNTDVKSAAEDIIFQLSQAMPDFGLVRDRIGNIKALSEILSARSDFLDYFANPELAQLGARNITVYRKFDKTIQSLGSRAAAKSVQIDRRGNSVGEIRGARVFEVIPYLVIENAIKYSPPYQRVLVEFYETREVVRISVRNLGPALRPQEMNKVFDAGFRGQNAVQARTTGFGIGLFFLKDLVERLHKGTVRFSQYEPAYVNGGMSYLMTELQLTFTRVA